MVTESLENKPVLVGNLPCEFPLTNDSSRLRIMTRCHADYPAENIYVWQKYEEMTGVGVDWLTINKANSKELVNVALTNKQDIDLIIRCRIPAETLAQYGDNGLILDLAKDGMLQRCAPNCWAYLQSHPDALAAVTSPSGEIYSLPQVNAGAELRVSRKIFINKKWLDNLGLSLPSTTEEFYTLLKAFKEQDANGNGDPHDEIPICSQDWSSVEETFLGAFGLANRGVHNLTVDCDETTNGVRLIAASDEYRSFLEYFNRLYTEGLLDNNVFTISMEEWLFNAENDRIGVYFNTNLATMPADKADNWIAVEEALEGPNGNKLFSAVRANFHSTGAAVIPSTCSNPELALRWLDYFWTDEGTLFYHMGIEGDTFVVTDDGHYDYSERIYNELKEGSSSFDDVISHISPYPGGGNPTVEVSPYFKGGEMADLPASAARALFEYGPTEFWPSFTFTSEENTRLDTINTDLNKYITTSRKEFITGSRSLSKWNEYTEQLEALGSHELLSIYSDAVERFYQLKSSISEQQ